MEAFTICVIYKAKSTQAREDFINEISNTGILSLIRGEDGCLTYDYYLSCDDNTKIVLFEAWRDKECQKVHMTQPHMKTAMEIKSKYIDSVELKELTIK